MKSTLFGLIGVIFLSSSLSAMSEYAFIQNGEQLGQHEVTPTIGWPDSNNFTGTLKRVGHYADRSNLRNKFILLSSFLEIRGAGFLGDPKLRVAPEGSPRNPQLV